MDSIYLRILRNQSEPILHDEDDWFVLFAKRPCNEGHLLLVPKRQAQQFFELPDVTLHRGFQMAKILSTALSEYYKPPRIILFIKGFTVDNHAHIHICPAYASEDIDKDLERPELTVEQMQQLRNKLYPGVQAVLSNKYSAKN